MTEVAPAVSHGLEINKVFLFFLKRGIQSHPSDIMLDCLLVIRDELPSQSSELRIYYHNTRMGNNVFG